MLDVVDTPYRGRVLCLMWWIRHTEAEQNAPPRKHNTPPLYGVSTTVVRIGSLALPRASYNVVLEVHFKPLNEEKDSIELNCIELNHQNNQDMKGCHRPL